MPKWADSGRSKGIATVAFHTAAGADAALLKDGHELMGRWLSIAPERAHKYTYVHTPGTAPASATLFVGNVNWDCTEAAVREKFEPFGRIVQIRWGEDRATGAFKGFFHVVMGTAAQAAEAMRGLQGSDLIGRRMRIDFSEEKPRGDRGGGGQDRYGKGSSYANPRPAVQARKQPTIQAASSSGAYKPPGPHGTAALRAPRPVMKPFSGTKISFD
jgi:nucleolin